jgi:bacteriocin-like protein
MKTFEEINQTEMQQVEGGSVVIGALVVVGAAAIVGAFLYGQSQGSKDCPLTPK